MTDGDNSMSQLRNDNGYDAMQPELPAAQDPLPAHATVRRYVVQLGKSPNRIDPLDVPCLDLFDLYFLYCSAAVEDGIIQNHLRLGYFSESRGADVLALYLAAYFESPQVVEVDPQAEERSMPCRFVPLKEVGNSGRLAAVEVTSPRPLLPRAAVAAWSPSEPEHRQAVRSIWSRLLGRDFEDARSASLAPLASYASKPA
jgi:hypothetical protein